MMRKTFATLGVLVLLLVSIVGVAAAQSGTDATPTATPSVEPEETAVPTAEPEGQGSKFYNHPIVQLLDKYFGQDSEDEDEGEPVEPGDPNVTPTPAATGEAGEVENESGLSPIGEEIAAYHEDGMGFGQLVKIYAMVKASEEACAAEADETVPAEGEGAAEEETCTPLTAEELVTAVKGGAGMGSLFKEYGKPALLGVGHVKKALREQEKQAGEEPEQDGDPVLDDDENQPEEEVLMDAKGNKLDKEGKPIKDKKLGTGKQNKSKGNKK